MDDAFFTISSPPRDYHGTKILEKPRPNRETLTMTADLNWIIDLQTNADPRPSFLHAFSSPSFRGLDLTTLRDFLHLSFIRLLLNKFCYNFWTLLIAPNQSREIGSSIDSILFFVHHFIASFCLFVFNHKRLSVCEAVITSGIDSTVNAATSQSLPMRLYKRKDFLCG